jgi:protein-disulfide isomerase
MKKQEDKATEQRNLTWIWIGATIILAIALALSLVLGWQIPGIKGKLPGIAKEASPELLDNIRAALNLPPNVEMKVIGVTDFEVGKLYHTALEISLGRRSQKIDAYVSEDEQRILLGRMFTPEQIQELKKRTRTAVQEKIDPDKIPIAGRPVKGPADAPITIIEYSEVQCPYCRRGADTVDKQVLKEYGDKVKLVFKHFPLGFHKWAEPAAIASECAFVQDNEAFWHFLDYFFENQRSINPGNIREKALQLAEEANLDKGKFTSCYDNKETLARVQQDIEEGKRIGLRGVPAFFINGKKLSGAQPYERFKEVIDEELKGEKEGE